ncbi:MAG: hypothetical protein PSU72_11105 [Methylotenera sp.]|nr:type IIL restriction-modification enzyme MmeI [Methylotenera sp.]MDI1362607.1 hypothetical protein [Methylotenera sp.]
MDVQSLINVDVDQFYGIEIEEFPAQIAQVALWLTDHQMNMRVSEEFGAYFARIPLKATPHIICANALQVEWSGELPIFDYIFGNPPFLGKSNQSAEQKIDLQAVCSEIKNAGLLDFVAAWYVKSVRYIRGDYIRGNLIIPTPEEQSKMRGIATDDTYNKLYDSWVNSKPNPKTKCAFVSTNSITQGEQVGALWAWMLAQGIKIHFAHRTFSWSNEVRGKAAVHCVIIGFGLQDVADKTIYEYVDIKGEPHAVKAGNINPCLVDAPDLIIEKSRRPICAVPKMTYGSKPADGGNLILTEVERATLLASEPSAEHYVRPYIGSEELINGNGRYCLWLKDASPQLLRKMPLVLARVEAVRQMRLASTDQNTRNWAEKPSEFQTDRQPESDYLALPEVSSELRKYIPIAYLPVNVIASNLLYTIEGAGLYDFGFLCSSMHMAWLRTICGRLKSDYRYSASLVYNNFPWPVLQANIHAPLEACSQAVLDARAAHINASLADLYDPLTMPTNLLKAHQALDKAVDAAYGYKGANTDAARVAFLFERYQQLTSLLPPEKSKKPLKRANNTCPASQYQCGL